MVGRLKEFLWSTHCIFQSQSCDWMRKLLKIYIFLWSNKLKSKSTDIRFFLPRIEYLGHAVWSVEMAFACKIADHKLLRCLKLNWACIKLVLVVIFGMELSQAMNKHFRPQFHQYFRFTARDLFRPKIYKFLQNHSIRPNFVKVIEKFNTIAKLFFKVVCLVNILDFVI